MFTVLFRIFLSTIFLCEVSIADPNSDYLLQGGSAPEDLSKAGLESGRYKVKDKAEVGQQETIYVPPKKVSGKKPASVDQPAAAKILPTVPSAQQQEEAGAPAPDIKDQVDDLLNGGAKLTGVAYREQIHPDDIRMNTLEIDFSSGLIYNTSLANSAYRKYSNSAPFLAVAAHVWPTPLVGMTASYLGTFGEDLGTTTNANNRIAVKSDWLNVSVDFRKFYGMSRRANSLMYGIIYSEYKLTVPAEDTTRIRLKSSGVGLYLAGRFPVTPGYSWVIGGEALPFVTHQESATGTSYNSGGSSTNSRVGFHVGGEFKMSRQQQLTWTLGSKIERNQFSGSANMVDPETSATPSGVTVTNTWSYFNLGYRWGQ